MTVELERPDEHTVIIKGKRIEFEQAVVEVLEGFGKVLVRLRGRDFQPHDPNRGRNILAFDENGKELWRIEDAGFKVRGGKEKGALEPYSGMFFDDGGQLVALQPIGCECVIDKQTGNIIDERITK